jgi:CheY-like chemotaxis protein
MSDTFTPTILIVDDDTTARKVVAEAVIELGVNIVEADNGRAALSILKKQPVNLVISDLIMPKMSGLMLLHSLLEQGRHLPFILVTSYSDKDSAVQALRLGAFDYLEKPVDIADLQSVVREAIQASSDQQQLISIMNSHAGQSVESFAFAEMQILRMRTFRAKHGEFNGPIEKGNINNWQDLRTLFVSEAEQQLIFCRGAIDSLSTSESKAQELGYILRIVQSIRLASEAIRLTDISDFTWAFELFIAALKSKPAELCSEKISLLTDALSILSTRVSALLSADTLQILSKLEEMTAEIRSTESQRTDKLSA